MPSTTRTRDPFIDLIRVLATALVVLQHCLMPVLAVHAGQLTAGNALATPGWWVVTWVSQVMPLVFLAGGAANAISYRAHQDRGGTPAAWLGRRVRRLALPVLPVAAVWLPLPHLLLALGVPEQPVRLAAAVVPQLLWFLVVYLAAVLATPLAVAAHRRFGLGVLPVLAAAALLVDVARFGGLPQIGYVNAVVVWLAVHQLGVAHADGRFAGLGRRGAAVLASAGFGVTALLVGFGPYPASMVGMPGAPVSNMNPPTLCLLTLAFGQLGLALLARDALLRWAARPVVATALRAIAPRMMTVYLWHMSALAVIAGVTVVGLGYHTPAPGTVAWWIAAPTWVAAVLLVLRGLVRGFGRFEEDRRPAPATAPGMARTATGTLLVAAGLLGLTAGGFAPPTAPGLLPVLLTGPVPWIAALLAGLHLVSAPSRLIPALRTRLTSAIHARLTPAPRTRLTPALRTRHTPALRTRLTSALRTRLTSALRTLLTSALRARLTSALRARLASAPHTRLATPPQAARPTPLAHAPAPVTASGTTPAPVVVDTPTPAPARQVLVVPGR